MRNDVDVRAAELVDRLVRVAHTHHRGARPLHELEQAQLHVVRVLELVNKELVQHRNRAFRCSGVAVERAHDVEDQIVEVADAPALALCLEVGICSHERMKELRKRERVEDRRRRIEPGLHPRHELTERGDLVDRRGIALAVGFAPGLLKRDAQCERELRFAVLDLRVVQRAGLHQALQQAVGETMKRQHLRRRLTGEPLGQSSRELLLRVAVELNDQDPTWIDAVAYEPCDALHQRLGLAGSRDRGDQRVPADVCRDEFLLGRQRAR